MSNAKRFFIDCKTMFKRCIRLTLRNPEMLVVAVFVPVTLLVLFVYIFGGVMDTSHFGTEYVNYVFIGVLAVAICQGAATQATVVCADVQKGVLDRFISLPISRASFVIGHVLSATLRTTVAVILLFGVGFAMGFRPVASFPEWIGAIAILLGFIFAMSWLAVLFGLLVKTVEAASSVTMFAQIIAFLSSAFVPTATMPAAIRYFSEYQPVTPIVDTMRSLFLGVGEVRTLEVVLWLVGLFIIGFAFSVIAFNKRIKK